MTALNTDDLALVTGPLAVFGGTGDVLLFSGEVVQVLGIPWDGVATVLGHESGLTQCIDITSLTPFSEIIDDPDIFWGNPLDPDYIHDYVWSEEDE